jgi:hypothetical protein
MVGKTSNQRRPEIHLRLDHELRGAIEKFRAAQECPPSPPEAVRHLVRRALAAQAIVAAAPPAERQ